MSTQVSKMFSSQSLVQQADFWNVPDKKQTHLMLCDECLDLLNLLREHLLVLLTECGLSPLQPSQKLLQKLLGGEQLTEGTS